MNFTPELKGLLHEMNNTRAPDSSFLFPSPKRGERDIPTKSLRESFKLVRTAAGGYPPQGVVGPRTAKGIPWPRCWPLR